MPALRRGLSSIAFWSSQPALAFWWPQALPGRAQEVTLKAAVFVPPSTTYGIPFKRFVDHVNETGKGVLQIRIVGGPEAVPADGQAAGGAEPACSIIASIPTAYYKSLMVEGDAQVLNDLSVAEQRQSGALRDAQQDRQRAR